jgi:sugar phosphate isomerase/epimerase
MDIGCFALVDPFSLMDHQLERIKGLGFAYADVTDNHNGGMLGTEFGFTASVSLDANPHDLRRMFARHGLTPTTFCAHANLLDPPAPWRYGTTEIIKAVRAAAAMGVRHVITTEGEPKTAAGHGLSPSERIFAIRHALAEPIRVAADFGVTILLEPHGPVTDSIDTMDALLEACGNPDNLAINVDTGNIWLGGSDPVAYVRHFRHKIEHVHWKDLPAEMEAHRGTVFGSGMTLTPLGAGVVDIAGVHRALLDVGFDGHTTLEVAGDTAVLASRDYLLALECKPADVAASR